MRKFSKKAIRSWLDTLAKVCVKTRDDFTCQIQHEGCAGAMMPLDNNCQWCHIVSRNSNNLRWVLLNALCGCGHCHQWVHANPTAFGVWFANKYPYRYDYLNAPRKLRTWREPDFRLIEKQLLLKAIDLEVDVLHVPTISGHRRRFEIRIEELKGE